MPKQKRRQSTNGGAKGASGANETAATGGQQDAVSLLSADHRNVENLFSQFDQATSAQDKQRIASQVARELVLHALLEEEIFYPACREKGVEHALLDEAQVEHDAVKLLIADVLRQSPDSEFYDAKVTVLAEYVKHHVGEEEKPGEGIFAKAQEAGVDMAALGQSLQARKSELMADTEGSRVSVPPMRALEVRDEQHGKESYMSRQMNEPGRDERGRFTSDEYDERGSRGGGRGQGGRSGDQEGYSEGSRRGWEERGGDYRSRGREDDDDDYRRSGGGGGGRGQGGWSGDPEGHSEASRRGWEERGGGGGSRSRGRDEDDDYRRGGGGGGGGRGHGGWFGDSEGHSEASRRGWEERGGGGSRSRGRGEDDENGGSRRGHGGWFGDPEGHAEAARQRNR
jgi:hemerythrin superfamily protein